MTKVALQTYTIRKYLKNPAAIDNAFSSLKNIGINAVELARINFKPAEIDAVAAASKQYGVDIGSSQITYKYLQQNFDWVVDFHRQLGCKNLAVSVLPTKVILGNKQKWIAFAKELNELGARYREQGLNLLFHHHDFEFKKYHNQRGLDILLENTQVNNIGFVIDTYWTQRGGCSPHDLISDLNGRVKIVHLRDFKIRWKYFDLLPQDCELGQGNLDFTRIINSCENNGVEYMAIEQTSSDPFASIATSVECIKQLGFSHLL
jgi:sugar phosphate isomerase/epimerase